MSTPVTPGQAAYERLASRVAAIAENLYESAAATHPSRKSEIQRDTADRIRQALAEPAECPVCAEIGSPHGVPQPAPEKPELPKTLGHPDDAAEEWLAETYEPDDANAVGYGRSEMIDAFHSGSDWARGQIAKFGQDATGRWRALEPQPAKEAREALAMAGNSDNEDAPVQAVIAIGHALLAAEERLTAIASAMNSPDNLGSQFGDELLERLEGIADELEMSRKDTGDRIREELAYIRAAIERSTRQ